MASSGPLAESPWLKRIWERLGGMFDQDREALAVAQASSQGIDPSRYIFERLIDSGDSPDMAVDAQAGIGYRYTCPVDQVVVVRRLTFWGVDASKAVPNGFFSLAALAATDGTTVKLHDADDSVIKDFTDGDEILYSAQLGMLAGVDVQTDTTANVAGWTGRWTIALAGAPARMTAGQYIEVKNNADLSGFDAYEWMAQGTRVTP